MKLATTDTQHHALEAALDVTREGSTVVKVDKEGLRALLNDHAAMVGRLGSIIKLETLP